VGEINHKISGARLALVGVAFVNEPTIRPRIYQR